MTPPPAKQLAFDLAAPAESKNALSHLTQAELLTIFDEWMAAGLLRSVDRVLAGFVVRHAPDIPPLALLGVILASHQAGQGHVCLDLAACLDHVDAVLQMPSGDGRRPPLMVMPRVTPATLLRGVTLADWQAALASCPGVVQQGDGNTHPDESNPPFIYEAGIHGAGQLYLRRYWQNEQNIVTALRKRLVPRDVPAEGIRQILDALFPESKVSPDWQKIACALAMRRLFALITGGPGTGKTTTVVKFLMLVQMQAKQAGLPPRRIRLCAPTGKAAARLRQSIQGQVAGLLSSFDEGYPDLRHELPDTVDTVHRLIGVRPNRTHPVHRAQNPLPADVVVVDEASMIGVELMAKLLAALDDTTQLILLGDQDQLASVEPGAVLGELASVLAPDAYTPETRDWLTTATGQVLPAGEFNAPPSSGQGMTTRPPLAQAAVQLQHSYRFDSSSDIGALARFVNAGNAADALTLLRAAGHQASVQLIADDAEHQALRHIVQDALAPWLSALGDPITAKNQDARALEIFAAHKKAQVLCALRHGPYGVAGLNRWIEDMLQHTGALSVTGDWYAGRPVMITQNDAALRLANGEIGITLPYVDPESAQDAPTLRVAFLNEAPQTDESPIRWVAPGRLTDYETAFALTVHKAQGSEFDHSVFVLPAKPNPVLTRELIYTAITRARQRFTLVTAASDTALTVLKQGIASRVQRSGQLGAKLAHLDNLDDSSAD